MGRSNRRRPEPNRYHKQSKKPPRPKRNPHYTGTVHAHLPDHGTCAASGKRCFTALEAEQILRSTRRARNIERSERSSYHCTDCGWTHLSSGRTNPRRKP